MRARTNAGPADALGGLISSLSSRLNLVELLAHRHIAQNIVGVFGCTSSTRPASPVVGMTIAESDTLRTLQWDGAAWVILSEPPQTWAIATYDQSGSKTLTATRAWTQRASGTFIAQARLTNFQAGAAGNAITMPTPFTLPNLYDIGGSFSWFDSGTATYAGTIIPSSVTAFGFSTDGVNNPFGVTPNFAPAAADVLTLTIHGRY